MILRKLLEHLMVDQHLGISGLHNTPGQSISFHCLALCMLATYMYVNHINTYISMTFPELQICSSQQHSLEDP